MVRVKGPANKSSENEQTLDLRYNKTGDMNADPYLFFTVCALCTCNRFPWFICMPPVRSDVIRLKPCGFRAITTSC